MSLSKALAIVCIFLLALLMFSPAPADQQPPLPHAQGAEPQKAAAAEPTKPPADITKLADAPTEDGFDD